jgi:hypothetical protein
MNENYAHAGDAGGRGAGHPQGHVPAVRSGGRGKVRANLMGSGTILREVLAAAEILEKDYGIPADVFSVPSFSELRREALDWSAGTCCIRNGRRACRMCSSASAIARGRSSRPPTTCASCPTRSASGCRAVTSRSAPTASVAATPAPRCAITSRSTAAWIVLAALKALADDKKLDRMATP